MTSLTKLEGISDQEIDRCLKALLDKATTEETMEFLMQTNTDNPDFRLCVNIIAQDLLKLCKEKLLERWDFDPNDITHRNQSILSSDSEWSCLQRWRSKNKKRILYSIVGAFRYKCHNTIDDLVNDFYNVQDHEQLRGVEDKAFELGVFIHDNGRMSHNCSFVDAKKAFQAYKIARQNLA